MEPPAAFDPANLVFEGVDFGKQQWHKVVDFPPGATVAVLDLSNGADAEKFKNDKYSIGRHSNPLRFWFNSRTLLPSRVGRKPPRLC